MGQGGHCLTLKGGTLTCGKAAGCQTQISQLAACSAHEDASPQSIQGVWLYLAAPHAELLHRLGDESVLGLCMSAVMGHGSKAMAWQPVGGFTFMPKMFKVTTGSAEKLLHMQTQHLLVHLHCRQPRRRCQQHCVRANHVATRMCVSQENLPTVPPGKKAIDESSRHQG